MPIRPAAVTGMAATHHSGPARRIRPIARWLLLACLAATACSGSDAPDTVEGLPSPVGTAQEVARGDGWRLVAQDSELGLCLELFANEDESFGCGFEVPERHHVGYFAAELGPDRFLAGPVDEAVTQVMVQRVGGDPIRTRPVDTSIGVGVYVVRVQGGAIRRVVALGATGQRLDALETPRDPWRS